MGCRLVPTSVTLNDLERRNSFDFCVISPNSIALYADYVTVVEDRPIMSEKYRFPVSVFDFRPKLTHAAARSLCDSWATYLRLAGCGWCCWTPPFGRASSLRPSLSSRSLNHITHLVNHNEVVSIVYYTISCHLHHKSYGIIQSGPERNTQCWMHHTVCYKMFK